MSRILKWDVPIDDQWHRIGSGRIVLVLSEPEHSEFYWRLPGKPSVLVWTLEMSEDEQAAQDKIYAAAGARKKVTEARVYGTGHDFPTHATYGGSCRDDYVLDENGRTVGGPFIWHVVTMSGYESE